MEKIPAQEIVKKNVDAMVIKAMTDLEQARKLEADLLQAQQRLATVTSKSWTQAGQKGAQKAARGGVGKPPLPPGGAAAALTPRLLKQMNTAAEGLADIQKQYPHLMSKIYKAYTPTHGWDPKEVAVLATEHPAVFPQYKRYFDDLQSLMPKYHQAHTAGWYGLANAEVRKSEAQIRQLENFLDSLQTKTGRAFKSYITQVKKTLKAASKVDASQKFLAKYENVEDIYIREINKIADSLDKAAAIARGKIKVDLTPPTGFVVGKFPDKIMGPDYAAALAAKYGPKHVDDFLKGGLPAAQVMAKFATSNGVPSIAEREALQDAEEILRNSFVSAKLKEEGLLQASVIWETWNHKDYRQGFGILPKLVQRMVHFFDPLGQATDSYSPGVREVFRRAVERHARFNDIFHEILLKNADDPFPAIFQFLERQGGVPITNGVATIGESDTLWNRARSFMLSDDVGSQPFQAIARAWIGDTKEEKSAELANLANVAHDWLKANPTASPQQLIEQVRHLHAGIVGKPASDEGAAGAKSIALAVQGILEAAVLSEARTELSNVVGRLITKDEVKAINAMIDPSFKNIDTAVNTGFDTALEVMHRLGLRVGVTQNRLASGGLASNALRQLSNDESMPAYISENLRKSFDAEFSDIVKEAVTRNMTEPAAAGKWVTGKFQDLLRLWRTAIVVGLFVPRPRNLLNNIIGDQAQMWSRNGLWTSTKLSFQNLPTNIPLGRIMQDNISKLSQKMSGKPVLGSISNALFNPHINDIWNMPDAEAAKTILKLPSGEQLSLQRLRKEMIEEGVYDTAVSAAFHEEVTKEARRHLENAWKGRWERGLRDWQAQIEAFVTYTQQRQRAGAYAEFRINQGLRASEAGGAMRKALFDWKNGTSRAEIGFVLTPLFMFYRYQRVSTGQLWRGVYESMLGPEAISKGLRGKSFTARAEAIAGVQQALPQWYDMMLGEGQDDAQSDYETIQKNWHPNWVGPRPALPNRPYSPDERQWLHERNLDYTHSFMLLPTNTIVDTIQLHMRLIEGMMAATADAADILGIKHTLAPSVSAAGRTKDWIARGFIEPTADLFIPPVAWGAGEGAKYFMGMDVPLNNRAYLKVEELALAQRFMPGWIHHDAAGRAFIDPMAAEGLRAAPLIEWLPTIASVRANPHAAKDWTESAMFMMRRVLGFKEYPVNLPREGKRAADEVSRSSSAEAKQMELDRLPARPWWRDK